MNFGLRKEIYEKIKEIVDKYEYVFVIFGSRARGDYKHNSDIDIAVMGEVTEKDIFNIKNDFDKVDMEYMMDIVFENKIENLQLLDNIKKEGVAIK